MFIARSGTRKNLYLNLVILPVLDQLPGPHLRVDFPAARHRPGERRAADRSGIIQAPLPMLYNDGAVILGLVYGYLPFMVLPLYATLERLDPFPDRSRSRSRRAPWTTLLRVIAAAVRARHPRGRRAGIHSLPRRVPVPDLLGGGKSIMIGNVVQNQFTTARDWPFGSALSLVLMAVVMPLLLCWSAAAGRSYCESPRRPRVHRRPEPLHDVRRPDWRHCSPCRSAHIAWAGQSRRREPLHDCPACVGHR